MKLRSFRRLAVASSFLIATGCTGADEPKLAEAPAFTTPPEAPDAEIKGKPKSYGSSKYQEAMEAQGARAAGNAK